MFRGGVRLMADVNPIVTPENAQAPATTGGSMLGDILAGIGGNAPNRPALGAAMIQGQAIAGLRTAQTENALLTAQQGIEEASARSQLENAFSGLKNPDGSPAMLPSQAHMAALAAISAHGSATAGLQAVQEGLKAGNVNTLSNPALLNTPAQTAASQGVTGKLAEPAAIAPVYAAPAGTTPHIQVSPVGAADIADKEAQAKAAGLRGNAQIPTDAQMVIAQGIRDNPNLAANVRSLTSQGGWSVAYALFAGHPYPGMGQGPLGVPTPPAAPGAAPSPHTSPNPNLPAGAAGTTPGSLPPGATEPNAPFHTPPNGVTPAPGVSLAEQAAIRKDFASGGPNSGASRVTSLNTMALHSILFDQVADQLANGQFTPTNSINVMWQRLFGQPAPTNLRLVTDFLGREAIRATVNAGAGTGAERELQIPPNASPETMHSAANTLRSLTGSNLSGLDLRARRGGVDITQLLDPETQQMFAGVLNAHGHNIPVTAPPAAAPGGTPGLPSLDAINAELARRAAGH